MANSDDRILLNLVLNEATVSAVEGRVRNLVNRLNNQNISLNINGRNLDNILNRMNDIQHRMQTINSTPVNINANLTSAQQQYRLETERMRVAQQLELSRQRTLQTENQAISALAQQNRTLTVNNNVTHQIEQGAQNIGHNMNVAGGHARDFVDYLADGVRYIVVYRSLYEIMNQIGESFSEMKNVDKELISVRKTTGMAENEIEKIRKASYGVATEYGRTASEYLGSVSEFARGGYKELSTELAKVSLLTQNVGDVSADSANKMLLGVDAAYKLNGNVTELTNVVNGLNNIANLNPTSMQKMADGMQVSASMAKVAGLEISDLVALIGTGTAVTQREGSEIARAIRTILMNIRAQKGELEDGTVIDDESIAKAEAALKGVGIATKEVVNGVRELRDPMDILDELAEKWSTLNTEAQSVVLESLANKRQANVLVAILENYEMIGKMQSEYFNSANSAVKENELYLQGWEATQKRVSAKWTEFVANMADTALITGSLNALYGVLVALDTPIGRIATSIVLVNTALAVSGRLWQAIRARSIVADILSMGVAERNLGTAIQLVTGHLGRQIAQWAMSPFGMATIAVAGIALITSAIEKNSQKLEENAQKAGEAYDKVKQNMNELDDLIKQYNDLQISNEWDNTPVEIKKQLHEDINKLLGDEADKVDILNGKYKETTEELFKQRMSKLPEEAKKAFDNEQAKGKSLWDTAYWNGGGGAGGYNYGTMQATDSEKKFIEKYEKIFDEKYYSAGRGMGSTDYVVRFDNFDDFMMKYEEAKKMLQELYDEGMGESELYKGLNSFIAKFDTKVGEYKTAVEELESTKAGQKLADYINTSVGGYVDDLDEYKIVVDWIKSNFTGKDADNALGLLNSYFSEYAEKVSKTNEILGQEGLSILLSEMKTASDGISSVASAFKEMNEDGYISIDTITSIKEVVGDSIDNWEDYEHTLLTAKKGSSELNKSLSDITYAILENKFGTEGLANATEEQIAAVLRENGVLNANEVAHDASARAKGAVKAATFEFADSLDATYQKLIDEGEACGLTAEAYAQLVAQETIFNNNELDVSGKIQKLAELQQALGVTASAAITLNSILSGENVDNRIAMATALQEYGVKRTAKGYSYNGVEYKSGKAALQAAMMAEYNSTSKVPSPTIPDFSGALSGSKDSKKDKAKEAADKLADYAEKVQDINEDLAEKIQDINEDLAEKEKEFAENMSEAWEEEHLETLKDIIKEKEDLLERHSKSMELIDFGLDIVGLNDFASRSDLLSSKLNEATQYGAGMRREFERLTAIIPQTAEEAEEIAGRIEALGSDMRENIKNIRETQVAIQMLRIEALDSVAEDRVSVLEAELDNIDKRISMLSSDEKNDYKYTNKILSMKSLIPDISSLKSAVDQKRNSDNQIIASEKIKQDTINKIVSDSLKKQAEANKKAREKERQQLIEDMDEARKDANKKLSEAKEDAKKQLAEAHKDYVDYLEENELATDATIQSIENKFKNANIELPKVDASSLEKSVDEVINKIKNKNIDINIKTVISQEGSGGIPLSESTAARNIQGATDCVRYAYARKKEITGYQGDIRYSGNGGDLGDASLGNRKIKDPNLYRDNLKSGAIMTMANGVAINPMTGRPYGHAIVVEKYDAETDTMWYSDNTTRGIARPVNFADFISRRSITGIIPVGVYAEGTGYHPGGKAILGDEKRGAYEAAILPDGTVKIIGRNGAELVDLPRGTQVIPHDETKAIMSYTGNLDGKKVPKYATGTPTKDKELLSYITAASQEWGVPANIIMAVMDQESAYQWVIGDGGSSYGYMQLNKGGALAELKSKGYADLAEKATWDKYSNIYAGTWFLRYLYDKYGDWETTLARYNGSGQAAAKYGKTVYTRAQSDEFLNAFSSQNKDTVSASDGAKTQNTDTASSTTSQADNTSKTDDYHDSVLGKIDDILYSIKMRKRTMGDEVDTSDLYREIQDIAHTEAQRLRDTGVPENSDEIRELIDVWWDAQDVIDGFVKTPAEEKFSEIQAMYDAFSAKVSESSIYSMAEQQKISDSDLSDDEKAKSLYRVANNVVESIGSISEAAYDEALTSFLAWVEGVSNGSIDFSQEVYDGYKELFNKIESSVYDAESGKSQRRQDLVGFMDKEIQNIDNYISTRDFYNDWGNWGDSKVSAIDRKIEIYKEYYNNGKDDIISTEEFNRYIVEAEHEKYTLMKEELVDYLNFSKEKFSSLQSLTKAHFEVLNNITETQHEIDKELAASKTMYEYLDKETQKFIFNQEDYNILSEELISIQEEAQLLQQKFNRDIRKSKEENIEEITSQYEMQYNLLMKSYEIAKADLEVAKKKQKLNNVLNERNVRMFIDGEWTWVANTQDVIDAQAELADAKYSSAKSNTELEQTQSLNKLTSAQNTLTTTINNVENGIIKFDREVLQINTKLGLISDSSIPALGTICDGATKAISNFVSALSGAILDPIVTVDGNTTIYDFSKYKKGIDTPISTSTEFDYSREMLKYDYNSSEWRKLNAERNKKINTLGMNFSKFETAEDWDKWKKANGYASGTNYATPGFHAIGEEEDEVIITPYGNLIPINQPIIGNLHAGSLVFNRDQIDFARKFWDIANLGKMYPNLINNDKHKNVVNNYNNSKHIYLEGVEIDNGIIDIDALQRYVAVNK